MAQHRVALLRHGQYCAIVERMNEQLLTVRQAAESMQVHPETLRRWLRLGLANGIRLPGGGWRISPDEVDRLRSNAA